MLIGQGGSALTDLLSRTTRKERTGDKVRLKVKLFADLAAYAPGNEAGVPFDLELPDASPVAELVLRLHLPEAGIRVIFVNGRSRSPDHVLQDQDEVGIFPAIGGG